MPTWPSARGTSSRSSPERVSCRRIGAMRLTLASAPRLRVGPPSGRLRSRGVCPQPRGGVLCADDGRPRPARSAPGRGRGGLSLAAGALPRRRSRASTPPGGSCSATSATPGRCAAPTHGARVRKGATEPPPPTSSSAPTPRPGSRCAAASCRASRPSAGGCSTRAATSTWRSPSRASSASRTGAGRCCASTTSSCRAGASRR